MPEGAIRIQAEDRRLGADQDKVEPQKEITTLTNLIDITADQLQKTVDNERVVSLKRRGADPWLDEQIQTREQIEVSVYVCIFVMLYHRIKLYKMIDVKH